MDDGESQHATKAKPVTLDYATPARRRRKPIVVLVMLLSLLHFAVALAAAFADSVLALPAWLDAIRLALIQPGFSVVVRLNLFERRPLPFSIAVCNSILWGIALACIIHGITRLLLAKA